MQSLLAMPRPLITPARELAAKEAAEPRSSRRERQGEEGLSFPGLLEQRQEARPEKQDTLRSEHPNQEPGTRSKPVPGAHVPGENLTTRETPAAQQGPGNPEPAAPRLAANTPAVQVDGVSSVVQMTDLMLKIKTGQLHAAQKPHLAHGQATSTSQPQAVVSTTAPANGPEAHAAQVDIQPLGSPTTAATPALDLTAVEKGQVKMVAEEVQSAVKAGTPAAQEAPGPSPLAADKSAAVIQGSQTTPEKAVGETLKEKPAKGSVPASTIAESPQLRELNRTAGEKDKGQESGLETPVPDQGTKPTLVEESSSTQAPLADEKTEFSSSDQAVKVAEQTGTAKEAGGAPQAPAEPVEAHGMESVSERPLNASNTQQSAALAGKPSSPTNASSVRQQVFRELVGSLDGKTGQERVVLQLNPEKLGQVEIQMAARGNDLNIIITAGSQEAEQAIREGLKDLVEGIKDKSARWQQVDIKVEPRGQDQSKLENRGEDRREQARRDQQQRENPHQGRHERQGQPDWAGLSQEG